MYYYGVFKLFLIYTVLFVYENLPQFGLPFGEHFLSKSQKPAISPSMRQKSPHCFPSQPWLEQGLNRILRHVPFPSHTPVSPLGQASPHGFPSHVSTKRILPC